MVVVMIMVVLVAVAVLMPMIVFMVMVVMFFPVVVEMVLTGGLRGAGSVSSWPSTVTAMWVPAMPQVEGPLGLQAHPGEPQAVHSVQEPLACPPAVHTGRP